MLGCEHRQTGGHRFQHRIWNTFLIAVAAGLAGMHKNMRLIIDFAQLPLRNKTAKRYGLRDVQVARKGLEFAKQRSFAGNRQGRVWVLTQETCESAKRHRQAFLLNQPAGLHETPVSVLRKNAFAK